MEAAAENSEMIPPGMAALLDKLDAIIETRAPEQKEMWTSHDIAAYTGLEYSTVRDRTTKRAGFPAPIRPNGTLYKIWIASEVKRWLRQQR
jgi:hypothetical protein